MQYSATYKTIVLHREVKMHCKNLQIIILLIALLIPGISRAAHPLITDDTGTQGKGKFQLELNGQFNSDKEETDGTAVKTTGGQVSSTLSYGIADTVDLVVTLPYQWNKVEENDVSTSDEKGVSDTVLEAKWRFWEKKGSSLALKPGIRFPTGNHEKGLGKGKVGGHLFLIGSQELGSWMLHANLGYIRNENKADEQNNIWHASLAATWEIIKDLKIVANTGIERNTDDGAKNNPAFLVGGIIYSVTENFDFDCGVKYGLTSSETDWSWMAGITIRF